MTARFFATPELRAVLKAPDKSSVRNWLRDPAFRREPAQQSDERVAEVKLRRAIDLTRTLDRLVQRVEDLQRAGDLADVTAAIQGSIPG